VQQRWISPRYDRVVATSKDATKEKPWPLRRRRQRTEDDELENALDGGVQIPLVWPPLSRAPQQLLGRETDVLGDLSEECWRDVASLVKGNCCHSTIGMPELLVGPTLTDFAEAQPVQKRDHFARLQGGQLAHYATLIV